MCIILTPHPVVERPLSLAPTGLPVCACGSAAIGGFHLALPHRRGAGLLSSDFPQKAKIRFQSVFMLITIQPRFFASSCSAWVKLPTRVSGSPCAGP